MRLAIPGAQNCVLLRKVWQKIRMKQCAMRRVGPAVDLVDRAGASGGDIFGERKRSAAFRRDVSIFAARSKEDLRIGLWRFCWV